MKCKNCPYFARTDYQWGLCKGDGNDKESEQSCDVLLLDIDEDSFKKKEFYDEEKF